ncbi:hypothetical protein FB566_4955 [Stackebrandtia endophytica]|uniref:Uncharacterized protein n=1 Tax=Stackebrandtia endophytica TaxID=1496996 RepID=A0A543B3F9_9ACTN|nr:hypothetical protein [Stackebrandtia endophytica]TQL79354.1 hypothetical protein FB566_4955 [Stackebrandtia endophytica]
MKQSLGTLIGASFGAVFVFANAGEPLPSGVTLALRILAAVSLLVVIVAAVMARGRSGAAADDAAVGSLFGGKYWLIVVIEVVAIIGGAQLLRVFDAPEQTTIAWVAFVVGVHFIPLARVWREPSILVPAYGLTVLGLVGFILAFTAAGAWTPIVSGVGSGVLFLGGVLYGSLRMIASRSTSPA